MLFVDTPHRQGRAIPQNKGGKDQYGTVPYKDGHIEHEILSQTLLHVGIDDTQLARAGNV